MSDQATRLRCLVEAGGVVGVSPVEAGGGPGRRPRPRPVSSAAPPLRLARAIAVVSGKGGVGKSNLAVNLAVAMSGLNRRVCLLDADLGMANVDVLCNLTPKLTLQHVVAGHCRLASAMQLAPGGFALIPGASGVAGMADLRGSQLRAVIAELERLERVVDVLIIDCAAGISPNVLAFAAAAHTTIVVATPEPTAVSDAYGMVKSLVRRSPRANVQLVVNMVSSSEEGEGVYHRMNRVSHAFLNRSIRFGGTIPLDPSVAAAVRHRLPFALYAPDGAATRAVAGLAQRLTGVDNVGADGGRGGFFARLAAWLRKS